MFDWIYEAADTLQLWALEAKWIDRTYDLSVAISWTVVACIAALALSVALGMNWSGRNDVEGDATE